jgi:imidazolonepropionase-like amidohydrolase
MMSLTHLTLTLLLSGPTRAQEPALPTATSLAELEAPAHRDVEPLVHEPALPVLLRDAGVMTAAGEIWEQGWVLLEDGSITALGPGEPPADTQAAVLSLAGRWITPGLIDPHSHIGVYSWPWAEAHDDGNEIAATMTAGVWAEHSLKPWDPAIERAVAGGVTTVLSIPGSANMIGGRGVVLQLVPTRGGRAMRFPGAPEHLKMACGENPKRYHGEKGRMPSTRMGAMHELREAFHAAERARQEWEAWEQALAEAAEGEGRRRRQEQSEPPEPPDRDLATESLVGVLRGEIHPQIHCYRADDMIRMLQLADELGFSIRAFHHATSAYKLRDLLAEREVAAVTWSDWYGFKMEALDGIPQGVGLLEEAGAHVTLHSDSPSYGQLLNQDAAKALREARRAGLDISEDQAIGWITAEPAWVLGIHERTGSLEPGKRADVVVWSDHPFATTSQAELVFIQGVLRYDRARPQTWSDFELGREVQP